MTPETEGKCAEKGPSGLPFINDPGNEDPGSLMDDATVPLNDADEALDEEYEEDEDEQLSCLESRALRCTEFNIRAVLQAPFDSDRFVLEVKFVKQSSRRTSKPTKYFVICLLIQV